MNDKLTMATREIDGEVLPAPGDWALDPAHTRIEFVARHLMVTKVRGTFKDFSGTVHIADDPLQSWVEVAVDLASVDTGNEDRDNHLRSSDFFEADKHPQMTYRSTGVEKVGQGRYRVTGDLTIKEETHPLVLDVEHHGVTLDPWGNPRALFSAEGEVNREDWGLTWNVPLETGGWLVSKTAKIEIEAQAVWTGGNEAESEAEATASA